MPEAPRSHQWTALVALVALIIGLVVGTWGQTIRMENRVTTLEEQNKAVIQRLDRIERKIDNLIH